MTWIILLAFLTVIGSVGTDIVGGICAPLGVYSSLSVMKAVSATGGFVCYMLPMMAMIFCYSRVVYTLKHKVTASNGNSSNFKFYFVHAE